MKAKLFFLFMLGLMLFANAQKDDLVFFIKDGASGIHEAKCSDMGELWVKVPVPSDITDYDNFTVFIYLSTIDYNLKASFDKNRIAKELVGRDNIDLFVLGPKETKTSFGDETVYNDLCNTPRNKGVDNFEVTVYTKGFKILRYETETKWDEGRNSYITRDIPIWDNGESYSESKFTIIQTSLSEGVTDTKGTISLKIPNLATSTFKNSEPGYGEPYLSQATIIDNSTAHPVKIRVLVNNGSTYPLNMLVEDFTNWANGKLINPKYYYPKIMYQYVEPTWRTKFNDVKDKVMTDFTIGNISGKQFTWYQKATAATDYANSGTLRAGYYAKIYFFEHGGNTYIALASVEDELTEYPYKLAYKLTPADAANADALIKQVLESIKFL